MHLCLLSMREEPAKCRFADGAYLAAVVPKSLSSWEGRGAGCARQVLINGKTACLLLLLEVEGKIILSETGAAALLLHRLPIG